MIDPTLRLEELARVAADPATGVVLLDVVLGHGAEPDPAARLAPAVAAAVGTVPVVVCVVGTAGDPQGLAGQVDALVRRRRRGAPLQRRGHPPRGGPARRSRPMTVHVANVGADLFADALADQAVPVTRVDWRPPMPGTEADLATVAADPLRREANAARARRRPRRARPARRRGAGLASCSVWSPASSCTPARRSPGRTPPVRCAAR